MVVDGRELPARDLRQRGQAAILSGKPETDTTFIRLRPHWAEDCNSNCGDRGEQRPHLDLPSDEWSEPLTKLGLCSFVSSFLVRASMSADGDGPAVLLPLQRSKLA